MARRVIEHYFSSMSVASARVRVVVSGVKHRPISLPLLKYWPVYY
jgi:hypothetical protein